MIEAIKRITSRSEKVKLRDIEEKSLDVEKPIWNSQKSYITFLALASSAPEVFMCFFNTFSDVNKTPSRFGPIVLIGSASFNLLVVTGVAITASLEAKRVANSFALWTMAAFATAAYFWLYLVLQVITPGQIDFTEALVTLLGYPALITVIWLNDRFNESTTDDQQTQKIRVARQKLRTISEENGGDEYLIGVARYMSKSGNTTQIQEYFKTVLDMEDLNNASLEQLQSALDKENSIDRIEFRRQVIQRSNNFVKLDQTTDNLTIKQLDSHIDCPIAFKHSHYTTSRNVGYVEVTVLNQHGIECNFWVSSCDGTALKSIDYIAKRQLCKMTENEPELKIRIQVLESDNEPYDKEFQVQLFNEEETQVLSGKNCMATVEIIQDDFNSYIGFKKNMFEVSFDRPLITIMRYGGASHETALFVQTDSSTFQQTGAAKVDINKKIYFEKFQDEATVEIECDERPQVYEKLNLTLKLKACSDYPDLKISRRNTCEVTITERPEEDTKDKEARRKLLNFLKTQRDPTWTKQFIQALKIGPTVNQFEVLDYNSASFLQVMLQFVLGPWKVLFALAIPPINFYQGWLAFIISVMLCGVLTFAIYSVLQTFACLIGMHECVTAVTLVAICTSIPDLVTSARAAKQSKTADPALLSILGANASNVFVGLGLPWTIITTYQMWNTGKPYYLGVTETMEITFILVVFVICSFVALLVLAIRRYIFLGELGGSKPCKWFSSCLLFSLWVVFVALCALECHGHLGKQEYFEPKALLATQIGLPPFQLDAPTVTDSPDDSEVYIQWEVISRQVKILQLSIPNSTDLRRLEQIESDGTKVDKVQVEIQATKGQFREITEYCDGADAKTFQAQKCAIPQLYFVNELQMPVCSEIVARIRAHNIYGWAEWSPLSTDNSVVKGCPDPMQLQTKRNSVTTNGAKVQWRALSKQESGCSPITDYLVEIQRPGQSFSDLPAVKSSPLIVNDLLCEQTYFVRGRARNALCTGKYSNQIQIRTQKCLNKDPPSVTDLHSNVEEKTCSLRYQWKANNTNKITVQFMDKDAEWNNATDCEQDTDLKQCIIEMKAFGLAPYNLNKGDLIQARIYATNRFNFSGQFDAEPVIFRPEAVIPLLTLLHQDGSNLEFSWPKQEGATFELQLAKGTPNDFQALEKMTGKTTFSTGALKIDKQYYFRMRAIGSCGPTQWSAVLSIFSAKKTTIPGQMAPVSTTLVNCNTVLITWDEPDDGAAAILEYEIVLILPKTKTIRNLNSFCNNQARRCSVPVHLLKRDFGFTDGDMVIARASARNDQGWGKQSFQNSDGAVITSFEGQVTGLRQFKNSSQTIIIWDELPSFDPLNDYYEVFRDYGNASFVLYRKTQDVVQFIEEAGGYRFKVRSETKVCGTGGFSEVLQIGGQMGVVGKMGQVGVVVDRCVVRFTWVENVNATDLSYVISVKNPRSGNFKEVVDCKPVMLNGNMTCEIPILPLSKSPFHLKNGDYLIAKGYAKDSQGNKGETSDVNPTLTKMAHLPPAITERPSFELQDNRTSVTITWDGGIYEIDFAPEYELFWETGDGEFTQLIQTMAPWYKVENIEGKESLKFKVRSQNECGQTDFSPVEVIMIGEDQTIVPPQMQPLTTTAEGCLLTIAWVAPPDSGSPILNYEISLQGSGQSEQFYSLMNQGLCSSNSGNRTCSIPMPKLAEQPFYLEDNDLIVVRGSSQNSKGWSKVSEKNAHEVVMIQMAKEMSQPRVEEKSFTAVTLVWDTASSDSYYELWWDVSSEPGQFTLLEKTKATTYTVENVNKTGAIKFKVRNKTPCNMGEFSQITTVMFPSVPNQIQTVDSTEGKCDVTISWPTPMDGNSPILEYKLWLIVNNKPESLDKLCSGVETFCVIKMDQLVKAPFYLKESDNIIVSVSAVNAVGQSVPSVPGALDGAAQMDRLPASVGELDLQERTEKEITFSWADVASSNYEVFWDEGNDNFEMLAVTYNTSYSLYIKEEYNAQIRVKVRSKTECFAGPFSPVLVIDFSGQPRAPARMNPLKTAPTRSGCKVFIDWAKPSSSQTPVKKYDVEIQGINGIFYSLSKVCDFGETSFFCAVPMKYLTSEPFNLVNGVPVVARGSAKNSYGWSKFSHVDQGNWAVMNDNAESVKGLRLVNRTPISATFMWKSIPQASSYTIYWDQGQNNFTTLTSINTTVYTATLASGIYKFKVAANLKCRQGLNSTILQVTMSAVPEPVSNVESVASGCALQVRWSVGADGGSPVRGYLLEVFAGGEFTELKKEIGAFSSSVTIKMSQLAAEPFNLKSGSPISIRVLAYNLNGYSLPTTSKNQPTMITVPPALQLPKSIESTRTSLVLSWQFEKDFLPSPDTTYELFYDSGGDFTNFATTSHQFYSFPDAIPPQFVFRVRAINVCDVGPFSPDLAVQWPSLTIPSQPSPVTTYTEGCSILIKWDSVDDSVDEYVLEYESRADVWETLECVGQETECVVEMGRLVGDGSMLMEDDLVRVRVAAVNSEGQGPYSLPNQFGAQMRKLPQEIGQPIVLERTSNELRLTWSFDYEEYLVDGKYDLYWAMLETGKFELLNSTYTNQYEQLGITKEMAFRFKVKAATTCGQNLESPVLVVEQVRDPPSKMTKVQLDQQGCVMHASWTAPSDDGGSEILQYKLEVMDLKLNKYWPLDFGVCGDSNANSCEIPFGTLALAPYNLNEGDDIVVRAYANNDQGWGPPGLPSNGTMIRVPKEIYQFQVVNRTSNSISVSWEFDFKQYLKGDYSLMRSDLNKGDFTPIASTTEKRFTISGVKPREELKLLVIADTTCGYPVSSEQLLVPIRQVPHQMQPVTTTMQGCNLRIMWSAPPNGGSNITSYRIEAQARGSESFYSLDKLCGERRDYCLVPMEVLAKAPFFLRDDDLVYVRAWAKNKEGQGLPSLANSSGAKMVWFPSAIGTPLILNKTSTSVTISWGSSTKTPNLYELYWDKTTPNTFEKLAQTPSTSFTITDLERNDYFQLRVGILTSCGYGVYSPVLRVSMMRVPGVIQTVSTFIQGCNVQISWSKPDDGGSPITQFQIDVQSRSSSFHTLPDYCGNQPNHNYCVIPLKTLTSAPFYLKGGDLIVVMAKAKNVIGWGLSSEKNTDGVKMENMPMEIIKPKIVNTTSDSATLLWNYAFNTYSNFNIYEIYWAKPDSNNWQLMDRTNSIKYTVKYLSQNGDTRFKVRAVTSCGQGPFSPEIFVQVLKIPEKVGAVSTTIEGCEVIVSWVAHWESESNDAYKIEILGYDEQFHSVNALCEEDKNKAGSCTIQMKQLIVLPIALKADEMIVARVSAKNPVGWGPPSEPNKAGVMMKNLGPSIEIPTFDEFEKSSVKISWEDVLKNDPVAAYEVFQAITPEMHFIKLATVRVNSFTVNGTENHERFWFKVRTLTSCGHGPFSPTLTVSLSTIPDQIKNVETSIHDCSLKICWEAPSDGRKEILAYKIEVQREDKELHTVQLIYPNEMTKLAFMVNMNVLAKEPFDLKFNQLILVRVSAENENGWSQPSVVNQNGLRMLSLPTAGRQPWIKNRTADSVVLGWDRLFTNTQKGSYELFWDNTLNQDFERIANTDEITFKVQNITLTGMIRFKLRSKTLCGTGPFSKDLILFFMGKPTVPCQMQPVITKTEKCNIIIKWVPPGDNGRSPILKYKIGIQTPGMKEFQILKLPCSDSPIADTCVIPMTLLSSAPFLLKYGDPVVVYVSAKNSIGWSAPSFENISRVKFNQLSAQVQNLRILDITDKQLLVSWDSLFSKDTKQQNYYELFWRKYPNGVTWTRLAATTSASYAIKYFGEEEIDMKVRGVSPCGSGLFSDFGRMKFVRKQKPSRMTPVTITKERCHVKLQWKAPVSELPILAYKIEVKSRILQQFNTVGMCEHGELTVCLLPMRMMTKFPYFLKDGDLIVIRIMAQNKEGWSEPSVPNEGKVVLAMTPPQLGTPRVVKATENSVDLAWDNVLNNDPADYYQLLWDKFGTSNEFSKLLTLKANYYLVKNIPSSGNFQFKVTAVNSCGFSSTSPVLLLSIDATANVPSQMQPIESISEKCRVQFTWQPPKNNGGSSILGYKVELRASNSEFLPIEGFCGSNTHPISKLSCIVDYRVFSESPFFLRPGDPIVPRVSAMNGIGLSPPSTFSEPLEMQRVPAAVKGLRFERIHFNKIRVNWDPISSDSDAAAVYQLYMSKGPKEQGAVQTIAATNATSYEMTVDSHTVYRFAVKSQNLCGSGVLSEVLTFQLDGNNPSQKTPEVNVAECQLTIITWDASLKVEIKAKNQRAFTELGHRYCNSGKCRVPINKLREQPFDFSDSDVGTVRVGMSEVDFMMVNSPGKVINAKAITDEPEKLEVRWDKLQIDYSYEVWVASKQANAPFTKVTETNLNFLKLAGLPKGRAYQLKIRAKNSCGNVGPFSNEFHAHIKSILPEVILPEIKLRKELSACAVKVNKPADLKIEVQTHNKKQFSSEKLDCDQSTECMISMNILQSAPYNLKQNEKIKVRIGSKVLSDLTISTVPDQMSIPEYALVDGKMFLSWESKGSSDYPIMLYELFEDGDKISSSQKTNYVIEDASLTRDYHFAVRALNLCGYSVLSKELIVKKRAQLPTPVKLTATTCSVKFTMMTPAKVLEYKIEIKSDLKGNFEGIDATKFCNFNSNEKIFCLVPMKYLSGKPFNLIENSMIITRVSQRTDHGWSDPININLDGIRMNTTPKKMSEPIIQQDPNNQISMTFKKEADVESVELWAAKGRKSSSFLKLTETNSKSIVLKGFTQGNLYRVKIKGKNSCGQYGPFSDEKLIQVKDNFPSRIMQVSLIKPGNKCAVQVNWTKPASVHPVIGYKIEVKQAGDTQFSSENIPCGTGPEETSCTIPMSILALPPYNLPAKAQVQMRISAQSSSGYGKPSKINTIGPDMDTVPEKLGAPEFEILGNKLSPKVKVTWSDPVDAYKPFKSYELLWGEHGETLEVLYAGKSAEFMAEDVLLNTKYRFAVRAKNICGDSPLSDESILEINGNIPDKMTPVIVQVMMTSCVVKFETTSPEKSEIFKIEVKNSQGEFEPLDRKFCSHSDSYFCVVPMISLAEAPFFLKGKDQIFARSKIENDFGWSEYSDISPELKHMMDLPTQMKKLRFSSSESDSLVFEWDSISKQFSYELWYQKDTFGAYTKLIETLDTNYIMQGVLEPGAQYKFKIRGKNFCGGVGPFSTVLTMGKKREVPGRVQGLEALEISSQCSFSVIWKAPVTELPILDYQIAVLTSKKEFSSNNIFCGQDSSKTTCLIHMQVLQQPPYSLPPGAPITVQVSARNKVGKGEVASVEGMIVQAEPTKMKKPRHEFFGRKIKVHWDALSEESAGYSPVTAYELMEINSKGFKELAGSDPLATSRLINWPADKSEYAVAVRARNKCGHGKISDLQLFLTRKSTKPGSVGNLVLEKSAAVCGFDLKWDRPDKDGGKSISSYLIEVQIPHSKYFVRFEQCGQSSLETTCTIPVDEVLVRPFKINRGDQMVVRVSAVNEIGASKPVISTPGISSVVVGVDQPRQMRPPEMVKATKTSITLTWEELDVEDVGNSKVSVYDLFWDKGTNLVSTPRVEGIKSSLTLDGLTPGRVYKFKVRARNACGSGPFSEVVVFSTPDGCPQAPPAAPAVSATQDMIEVTWEAPLMKEGDLPVLSYEILFQKKNGYFTNISTDCDGTASSVVDQRVCSIPTAKVKEMTGLAATEDIRVTVAGRNDLCLGKFSQQNQGVE